MQSFLMRVWVPASGPARAEPAQVTDATTAAAMTTAATITADVPPPGYRPSRCLWLGG